MVTMFIVDTCKSGVIPHVALALTFTETGVYLEGYFTVGLYSGADFTPDRGFVAYSDLWGIQRV